MRGWVGVDVSDASVKVVRIRRGPGAITVEGFGAALTPGGSPAARVEALRSLVESAGLQGSPAAVAIAGNEVVIRRFTLPVMKRSDILPALRLECRKHVAGPIEESDIRYEPLGRSGNVAASALDLLVAVAPRRKIEDARALLEQAGLKPACVTLRPVAVRALLGASVETGAHEAVAYLDVGALESHVTVLRGREIRFARDLGVGGGAFTDALRSIVVPGQGNVELTPEEAEALKRAHGIPFGAEEAGSAGAIPLTAVSVMLRPVLERLVRELWNSFDYVHEQFLGESVSRVVLLGEGSRIRNLAEYLTGVLKIPVARADRFDGAPRVERVEARPGAADSASELGMGLCLLEPGGMNFLASPETGTAHRLASAVPQKVAAAVAAVLLLSISLPAEIAVLGERQRVASLKGSLESVRPRAEALRRFRAARDEETRLHDLLARLSGGQVLWSYVLRDLSWRVTEDARLTTLEILDPGEPAPAAGAAAPAGENGREVRLSGLLRTDRDRPEKVLGELMDSLSRSPVLDQVRLVGCQAVTPALSSFTVTVRLAE